MTKHKNLKDDIVNIKIKNEQTLYELIINSLLSLEKNKLNEERAKFLKFKNSIEPPEIKLIPYNDLINNVKEEEKNDIKKNELIKELYNYCIWCFYSIKQNQVEKLEYILHKLNELKSLEKDNIKAYNSLKENKEIKTIRKKYKKYVGLKNLSGTSYINSVIQILFMIPQFRYSILSLNDGRNKIKGELLDDENILHQLQKLFTNLLLTTEPFYTPNEFFLSLKDLEKYINS